MKAIGGDRQRPTVLLLSSFISLLYRSGQSCVLWHQVGSKSGDERATESEKVEETRDVHLQLTEPT